MALKKGDVLYVKLRLCGSRRASRWSKMQSNLLSLRLLARQLCS